MKLEKYYEKAREQFSLQYDRNPIESIKSRTKSIDSILKKVRRKNIPLNLAETQVQTES